ncbi:MAG: multidrug effflux MFS transporter [Pseudomonadota bacterium]
MTPPTRSLHKTEFVALMAMLVATVALSIDSMLPAFPDIAAELTPDNVNKAQLIVSFFIFGMGVGTVFVGPLADAFGRKTVVGWASVLFVVGALLAWQAPTLEMLLAARFLQGLGAAGPRIVTLSIVRDLYAGRDMARILSFIFMIFSLIPAVAPSMGYLVITIFDWRAIFLAFVLFSLASSTWLWLRQPETLEPENRRPLRLPTIISAVRDVFVPASTRLSIVIQTLSFGVLFTAIQSIQPVFDITFDQSAHFHLWFAGLALVAMTSSMLNAFLVTRYGMRAILRVSYLVLAMVSAALVVLYSVLPSDTARFVGFLLFVQTTFYVTGLTLGNLNALALEPLGHIAGTASSVIAAISTICSMLIAIPLGMAFDGTPIPWAVGVTVCAILAYLLTRMIKRPSDAELP